MRIVTYNMRNVFRNEDGINCFVNRAGSILEKLHEEKPDVIGFQEMRDAIVEFFDRHLPEYIVLGHGRESDYCGEGIYTAIRRETVKLCGMEVFWLTDTPMRYSSDSECCPRTAVYTLLQNRENKKLFSVYNAHLSHMESEQELRLKQLKVIGDHARKRQAEVPTPLIVMGDFNDVPGSPPIAYMDSEFPIAVKDLTGELEFTFHGYYHPRYHGVLSKIDYIYTDLKTAKTARNMCAWKDEEAGVYLSDHFPVAVDLEL